MSTHYLANSKAACGNRKAVEFTADAARVTCGRCTRTRAFKGTDKVSPVEVDTQLAELYDAQAKAEGLLASSIKGLQNAYGKRVSNNWRDRNTYATTVQEVIASAQADLAAGKTYNTALPGSYVERYLTRHAERVAEVKRLEGEIAAMQDKYTGWSRFFVVTSSAGHVHRSMGCSTCRVTTAYGWLPNLSGKTEAEAVAELGATLCTVCFPSAPVEYTGGKITKAQAAKLAA